MKKFITIFAACFMLMQCFGQAPAKSASYFQSQYTKTLHDVTIGNNPWGMGLGLQLFLVNRSKLKPTIDLTGDAYLEDDKVYRAYLDGTPYSTVRAMVNLFGGVAFHPNRIVYLGFVGGPSFVGGQLLLGVKPSLGFYFSAKQKLTMKISYINIFNREQRAKDNFSSVSLSLGAKLF